VASTKKVCLEVVLSRCARKWAAVGPGAVRLVTNDMTERRGQTRHAKVVRRCVVELWRCSRFYFVLVGTNIYPETSYKSREGLQGREIACIDETTDASIYPEASRRHGASARGGS